jgi:SPP1 gp7 family putative phage head morphogenesis protein
MSQSQLQQVIAHYRLQLRQQESVAQQTLSDAYVRVLGVIGPKLDTLYQQIADAQSNGDSIPPSWLYEQYRLEHLTQFIESQINHYGQVALLTVGQVQQLGVNLGTDSAQAMLQSLLPDGVLWQFGRPSPAAIANLVGATQAGSPLASLFNGFGADASRNVTDALIAGLALGNGPREVALAVQQALNISYNRALTIARNEMLNAYRDAQMENYRANSDVVDQWRWTADLSSRTCIACLAMDGTLHDLSESLDSHVNCRCAAIPITKSWADILGPLGIDTSGMDDSGNPDMQSGLDWFNAQDESTQRDMLGPGKYDAWTNGDFTLQDIVGVKSDPLWGDSIYVKSIQELIA